jgi:hypothetical protein
MWIGKIVSGALVSGEQKGIARGENIKQPKIRVK